MPTAPNEMSPKEPDVTVSPASVTFVFEQQPPRAATWAEEFDSKYLADAGLDFEALSGLSKGLFVKCYEEKLGKYKGIYVNGEKETGGGHGHWPCNKAWRADDIYRYADWASDIEPRAVSDAHQDWVPFQGITECVQTVAQMCQRPQAHFGWPSSKMSFLRASELTWERLPPQTEFVLRSNKPIPRRLLRPKTGSNLAEGPVCYYSGGPTLSRKV